MRVSVDAACLWMRIVFGHMGAVHATLSVRLCACAVYMCLFPLPLSFLGETSGRTDNLEKRRTTPLGGARVVLSSVTPRDNAVVLCDNDRAPVT